MRVKILIRGGNLINKGAEAMLLTTVNQLKKRSDNVDFYVFPLDYEIGSYKKLGIHEMSYKNDKKSILFYFLKRFYRLSIPYLRMGKMDVLNQIDICRNFDGIIDISGYNYGDYWGVSGFKGLTIWLKKFNKRNNKFYILMPQAFGPFTQEDFNKYFDSFFANSELIFARDPQSYNYLDSKKANSQNLKLYPDMVFSFSEEDRTSVDIKEKQQLLFGYAPNIHVKKIIDEKFYEGKYYELIAEDFDKIFEKYPKSKIQLISTETFPDKIKKFDDAGICQNIYDKSNQKEKIDIVNSYSSSEDIYKQIKNCDLLIGSRFHSIIFALSLNIPVIVIGWSHKYEELMKDYDLTQFIMPNEMVGTGKLVSFINEIEKDYSNIESQIRKISEKNKTKNKEMFDTIAKTIRK